MNATANKLPRLLFIVNGGVGDAVAITGAVIQARNAGHAVDVQALGGNAARLNSVWSLLKNVCPRNKGQASKEEYGAVLCPTRPSALRERVGGLKYHHLISPDGWGGGMYGYCRNLVKQLAECYPANTYSPVATPLAEVCQRKPGKTILVGPGVGPRKENQAKHYDRWPQVIRYLHRPVQIIGDESAHAPWVPEVCARDKQVESLIGKTPSIADLLPIMATARAYFGVDNGLGHLAAACGVPVISIFGPTNPAIYAVPGARVYKMTDRRGHIANALHLMELERRGMAA